MASFTSISFLYKYNSGDPFYEITYNYDDGPTPGLYTITAFINSNNVGTSGNPTGPINVQESVYPQYFTQGISMDIYCQSDNGPTDSSHLYRAFMKANDSNNVALSSNLRRWTISDSNTNYTSVLLPPIATYKNEVFGFKYIDAGVSKSFSVVSGFKGYSNAPSNQLLVSSDSNFNEVYDYKFDATNTTGNIGRNEFTSANNLLSFKTISNGSSWLTNALYFSDSNLSITSAPIPASYQSDSNRSILFYDCTDSNLSTIVLSDSIQNNFEKNICIRNISGVDLTFHLLAPTGYDFETGTHISDRSQIALGCSNDKFLNLGLLSQVRGGGNRLYITTLYRGQGLTALTEYPTVPMTPITKDFTFVASVDPSLQAPNAAENSNYAKIYTIITTNSGDFSTISTYQNNSSNYFVVGLSNSTRTLSLDSNNWYTFASLYKNNTNTNVILPLSGFSI
jgi:hypothetical protein